MFDRPPRILIAYHTRPMTAGLFFTSGFRQAGCEVRVLGPVTATCYGYDSEAEHKEHVFPPADWTPPDFRIDVNGPVDLMDVLKAVREHWQPDAVVMIDQYDYFYLTGQADIPFAYVCVENWGDLYAQRTEQAKIDAHFHMIAHNHNCSPPPRPPLSEWLPFGFDPTIHRILPNVRRDKWAVQIGTAYQPRDRVWNHLRQAFDGAPPWTDRQYLIGCAESERTIFGRLPSYRDMAMAHNRALVALSSSNCDFVPMRACEAYAMGCLLASDDVPVMRRVLGPPSSEGGFWIAHDRTPEGHERAVREGVERYPELIDRGIAWVYKRHTYRARCERILERLGLEGAYRLAW